MPAVGIVAAAADGTSVSRRVGGPEGRADAGRVFAGLARAADPAMARAEAGRAATCVAYDKGLIRDVAADSTALALAGTPVDRTVARASTGVSAGDQSVLAVGFDSCADAWAEFAGSLAGESARGGEIGAEAAGISVFTSIRSRL